jgi:hypothetical protein
MPKALALLALFTMSIAPLARAEAPTSLKVAKVQAAGSGCPAGHALTSTANGVDALSIDLPTVKAELDGVKKLDREACNVTLEL